MYQPFANSTGSIALSLSLLAAVSTSSLAISVTADQVTVSEDTPAIVDVLSNDTDPDGDALQGICRCRINGGVKFTRMALYGAILNCP